MSRIRIVLSIALLLPLAWVGSAAPAAAQSEFDVTVYHSLDGAGADPRPTCPAGCTPTIPGIQAAAEGPKTVAVFDNPSFVDTGGGSGNESDTVQATLAFLGNTVTTFTGFTAADWTAAGAAADVILIPELEVGDLAFALDAAAQTAIANYVSAGGSFVVMGQFTNDLALLNTVFGYALLNLGSTASQLDTAVAAGTPFEGGPATLGAPSFTPGVDRTSLPAGALDIYHDEISNYVFTVAFGAGQVTRVAWDWFNAAPLGTVDGGWVEVLGRVIDSASGGFEPPPCDCVLAGGAGEELELWVNGGPTGSVAGEENVCQFGAAGGSGDEICGAAMLFAISGPGVFTDFYPDTSEDATIDTIVHDPPCTGEESCDLGIGIKQIRLNFVRGGSDPPTGPRKIGTLVVNSSGSTTEVPTTVTAIGDAAGANLVVRRIEPNGQPELIATTSSTPVPEPGGVLQIVSGVMGLGFLCRLRRWR